MRSSSHLKLLTMFLLTLLDFKCSRADEATEIETNEEGQPEGPHQNGEEFPLDGHVFVLTDQTFDRFLEGHPTALIEFYAPWCGHCKQLAPEFEKAAEQLAGEPPLAKVDATVETELAKRFDLKGYPTLKFWKANKEEPVDYDGGRDAQGIVAWLKQKTDLDYKPPPEEVVTLTVETFDEFVADKPIMLVEFYAPWCGHCKQLAPEYEKAATRLKEHGIPLAKVDATVEKKLGDEYGIKGYPTLKILRNGRRFDYDGPRDANGIVGYMLDQSKPAAKLLNFVKEVQKFMTPSDVTVIGFFESDSGPLFEAFIGAAEKTRNDFTFGYVLDAGIRQHYKARPDQMVLYYPEIFWSKHEPRSRSYDNAAASPEDLVAFLRENSTPLVGQKTRMNAATRYAKLPLVVVYYNVDFSVAYRDGTQYWRQKVLNIARKYKEQKYRFAVADEEEFADELTELGLGTSGLEHNVVVFGVDGKKYPMDPEKFDEDLEENLEAFLKAIGKGEAKPYVKSQPLPKEDKSTAVKTLVAKNFAKVVNDEAKDVLVEFYAPWCGHCKSFEPKYKQFAAKHAREEPNLVVAKFDATANDVPEHYAVEGFPTIYFAPSGQKQKPVKYTGNRDLADLADFVTKHAVKSFQKKAEKDEL